MSADDMIDVETFQQRARSWIRENLRPLGVRFLWEGAQEIVLRED